MQVISHANEDAVSILGSIKEGTSYRMLHFITEVPVDEGVLVYNLLTQELVWLTQEEYDNRMESKYMRDHWFVVPQDLKEKELTEKIRWVEKMRMKKSSKITHFTILTTSDCNARCFYCFELGWKRIPMSRETAEQTLEFIKKRSCGKKVHISWFGGEPLFNMEPMDLISQGLRDAGIEYDSSMITNGYLMDEKAIEKAKNLWNMTRVQIALDGTQEVYNKIKAYIYEDVNPYEVVMRNIGLTLDAGIAVAIRMNMDLSNYENLLELVDELALRFKGKKRLCAYVQHLFKVDVAMEDLHSAEEWEKQEAAMDMLERKIESYNLNTKGGIAKGIKVGHCIADRDSAVVIHSTGALHCCEHCEDSEIYGHVTSDEVNMDVINSWKEKLPEIPECEQCFYYPNCYELKKCTSYGHCFRQTRDNKLRRTKLQMSNEYLRWKMTKE